MLRYITYLYNMYYYYFHFDRILRSPDHQGPTPSVLYLLVRVYIRTFIILYIIMLYRYYTRHRVSSGDSADPTHRFRTHLLCVLFGHLFIYSPALYIVRRLYPLSARSGKRSSSIRALFAVRHYLTDRRYYIFIFFFFIG